MSNYRFYQAYVGGAATQFIVCSVGIGDAPQQAKSQGVYHLALLATMVLLTNTIYNVKIYIN